MRSLFINILTQLGTFASLIGLLFAVKGLDNDLSGGQWLLLILSIFFLIISLYIIIKEYNANKPLVFKNERQIRDYMYNWINNSGRTVIFTRDMSWVSDNQMKEMLNSKARNGELIICLPNRIAKINEYEMSGASIIEYSSLNYAPLSRFTITNFGRDDARVAVGKSISNGKHLIEEFGNGEHPYFQVANDLFNVVNSVKVRKNVRKK